MSCAVQLIDTYKGIMNQGMTIIQGQAVDNVMINVKMLDDEEGAST